VVDDVPKVVQLSVDVPIIYVELSVLCRIDPSSRALATWAGWLYLFSTRVLINLLQLT
jgi:hypothetical protein